MTALTRVLMVKKTSILILPEGTRNKGRNLLPFKTGAFKMAIKAGVPIIPICISSYARHINLHRLKSCQVEIKVLPPIFTDHLTEQDTGRIMQQCWNDMKSAIDAMDRKIY
jgi:1-acyl-sn-glycerol-3-phosphate acyltransferase